MNKFTFKKILRFVRRIFEASHLYYNKNDSIRNFRYSWVLYGLNIQHFISGSFDFDFFLIPVANLAAK